MHSHLASYIHVLEVHWELMHLYIEKIEESFVYVGLIPYCFSILSVLHRQLLYEASSPLTPRSLFSLVLSLTAGPHATEEWRQCDVCVFF